MTDAAAAEAESYRLYNDGKDIITQDIAPAVLYEGVVRCLWMNTWLDSYSAGDAEGRAAAVTVLEESLAWPATVATDGGGVIDHMSSVVSAAADGDLASVKTGSGIMQCAALTKGITR